MIHLGRTFIYFTGRMEGGIPSSYMEEAAETKPVRLYFPERRKCSLTGQMSREHHKTP